MLIRIVKTTQPIKRAGKSLDFDKRINTTEKGETKSYECHHKRWTPIRMIPHKQRKISNHTQDELWYGTAVAYFYCTSDVFTLLYDSWNQFRQPTQRKKRWRNLFRQPILANASKLNCWFQYLFNRIVLQYVHL